MRGLGQGICCGRAPTLGAGKWCAGTCVRGRAREDPA